MKIYQRLANATFWFHWIWAVLLVLGSLISVYFPWYKSAHAFIVTITITSQIVFLGCPLVALENAFRAKYNPREKYYGSFICHYFNKHFGIKPPPLLITALLIVITIVSAVVVF